MRKEKLGALTKIRTGKIDVNAGDKNGKYPFFTCAIKPYRINSYAFDTEALIIAGNGDLNVKYYKGKFNAYQRTYVIEVTNKTMLNMKYLYYFMQKLIENLRKQSIGGVIKYIKLGHLTGALIPLPPLNDQIRIATLLSRVEALIAKRKDNLRLVDEFLKSIFLEMFGIQNIRYKEWKIEKLVQHANIVSGVTKGKKYVNEALIEIPYMRVANVQDGHFNLEEIKTIFVTQKEINNYELARGDVLLTEGGDPDKLGRGSVWEEQIEKCIHQNHIFRVRVLDSDEVNPYYLSALIGSKYGKSYFLKAAKQTTGIASINSTQLKNFPLIIPPITLQNKYVTIAKKADFLKNLYQQNLSELENLYGALSQKAFKGELDLSRIPLDKKDSVYSVSSVVDTEKEELTTTTGYAMSDPAARDRLLRQLFDAFVAELKEATFSFEDFWTQAEIKVIDHMDEESLPLGIADYDKAKAWLFDMLKNGQVNQRFDERNNRMELSTQR